MFPKSMGSLAPGTASVPLASCNLIPLTIIPLILLPPVQFSRRFMEGANSLCERGREIRRLENRCAYFNAWECDWPSSAFSSLMMRSVRLPNSTKFLCIAMSSED
jgi:hypothetical protein